MTDGSTLSELSDRLTRLEDAIAIERLMARYGECVDNDYDLEGMKEILSPDLRWESNAFGSYGDRAEYLAGQREIAKGVEWAFHSMAPVRVTVNGDRADGTFYLLMLATFKTKDGDGRVPIILSARYDNRFVRNDGRWWCDRMRVQFHQVSDVTRGWVDERFFAG
jgi:hypothetical protein